LKGEGAKRVARIVVVAEVVLQPFLVLPAESDTVLLGKAMQVVGSEKVYESDIPKRCDWALDVRGSGSSSEF
jgi:hypothetical protein